METSDRRIRKLKLKARDENHVRRGVALLEDGFRSASFPGLPPNCLVVVRHIDLGTISTSNAPATISLCIEDRLRTLSAVAVLADEGEVNSANIVWFRDSLQPYVTLAKMIARGQAPTAWYWASAAPDWRPNDDHRKSLVNLLQAAAQSPAGAVGTARLVQVLHEIGKLGAALGILEPPDALTILRHSALYPRLVGSHVPRQDQPVTVVRTLPLSWRQTLAKWAQVWGEHDVRTTWLIYTGLVNQNPALSETSHTGELIQEVIHDLVHEPDGAQPAASSRAPGKPTLREALEQIHEHGNNFAAGGPGTRKAKELGGERVQFDVEQDDIEYIRSSNEQTAYGRGSDQQTENDPGSNVETSFVGSEHVITDGAGLASRHNQTVKHAQRRGNVSPESLDIPGRAHISHREFEDTGRSTLRQQASPNGNGRDASIAGLRPTDAAGLVFLVPVLELLGIRELLDRHPLLAECNLPARLLWLIVHRLNIDFDDPACAFIPALPEFSKGVQVDFVAPQCWRHLARWPSKPRQVFGLRRIAGRGDSHVLTDFRGRQALALWTGKMPLTVQPWIEDSCIEALTPLRKCSDIEFVEGSFLLMIGRFLRFHAGIGLRSLVTRPGKVATTPTWVDVVFDEKQADIRVRKSGIDINPGWVPWLGKVIQFHYLQNEKAEHDQ